MNRLATEPSPYLRQHAENPVDWYPWGPEALQRARTEHKPILLSVGYSACHWCHVMAHESFEDPRVAEVMNARFINIKVDREERPDLDQLYQGVVALMGRGGGWPLTVFLTPDLRPFYGGTYFPPAPRHGLPAFATLLTSIGEAWVHEPEEIERQAVNFKEGLLEYTSYGLGAAAQPLTAEALVTALRSMSKRIDRVHGGFGSSGPKFPEAMNLAAMLRGFRRTGEASLRDDVLFSLEKLATGGVYDQLGGGFHRYSVDERWLVPHFEKMLYDNAQLLHLLCEAQLIAPRPLWQKTVEETIGWLAREMTSPEGGFFSAQDADSEGEEGKYFVWRRDALDALLGLDHAALLAAHFNIVEGGNFEHGATVLEVARDEATLAAQFGIPLEAITRRLTAAKATLLRARAQRVPPGRDDKILTGWNGLMIRALALASRVFDRPDWLAMAVRAATFVCTRLRPSGRLLRSWSEGAGHIDAMLEDVGDLALGLVGLYQATFDFTWLETAEQLADEAHQRFWSDERTAYLAAPKTQADLVVPTFALHDNAYPSGASTLTDANIALAALTGHTRHLDRATAYLEKLASSWAENPFSFGHLLQAADALLDGAAELTLTGTAAGLGEFTRVVNSTWAPTIAVHRLLDGQTAPPIAAEVLQSRPSRGPAAAYVCRHFACQPAVTTVSELRSILVG
jgi:uncharacterized protein